MNSRFRLKIRLLYEGILLDLHLKQLTKYKRKENDEGYHVPLQLTLAHGRALPYGVNFVLVVLVNLKVHNVVVADTSYQMLEVLPFCDRERA